jgi:hypothetical protein
MAEVDLWPGAAAAAEVDPSPLPLTAWGGGWSGDPRPLLVGGDGADPRPSVDGVRCW